MCVPRRTREHGACTGGMRIAVLSIVTASVRETLELARNKTNTNTARMRCETRAPENEHDLVRTLRTKV